jgi:3-methylfumaryl-CoA hydratase
VHGAVEAQGSKASARHFTEVLDAGAIDRLAALLDLPERPAASPDLVPEGWHWVLFNPRILQSDIAEDGHQAKGHFLPDLGLPLRMFGGADAVFHRPLKTDHEAELSERVVDIRETTGRQGRLGIVKVERLFHQFGQLCLTETQSIIYRDRGPAATAQSRDDRAPDWREEIVPNPVALFRFSALTFNGHRIHYDRDYAMGIEGYPGLVVHGPFIALTLLEAARRRFAARRIARFSFRSLAPLFDTGPFFACGLKGRERTELWAENSKGGVAMQARVEFGGL